MTKDEFNSWAADIANDYAQAVQEMGPDDYETWYQYRHRRLDECDEAYAYVMNHASTPATSTYVADDDDDDELPF